MIRQTTVLALLLAAAISVVLFTVKYQVQELEDELTAIERGIVKEERAIHVLRAEWAYLNDPARLHQLAERLLGMGPISARQLGSFESLAERQPDEEPVVARPVVVRPPVAGIDRGETR